MKVIWAPWRMAYIKHSRKPAACIFCTKARGRRDADNLLLHRGQHGFVMMNLFPYNSGHLMVAPYAHVKSLESLPAECALDLIQLTNLSLRVLRAEIRPEGFNVGINLGRVSGAGIEEHVHVHIVPRWNGDTNFMPLFAETRVIPEHLQATYRKLRARFRLADTHDGRRRLSPGRRPKRNAKPIS
ncbi:MAG: HIT domain-containing protein [Nitrospirae bacterium]|nr:HIT domain-containing protein [Nitrospirota bacterium]